MPVRADSLTPHDMALFMAKLASNFGGKKDLEARTDTYFERLERFPIDVVRRAVDRVLDETHKYFPLVGHIKTHCVAIEQELGYVDDSPRATMQAWEADPFADVVYDTPEKRAACPSRPCPVCEAVMIMSPRGYVIRHDDAKHTEAQVSYCNVGRVEWFEMGPPVMPAPKKKPPAAAPIADVVPVAAP